jgi:hypothetical protein
VLDVVSGEEDVVGNVADKVLRVVVDDNAVVDMARDVAAPCRRRRRWRLREKSRSSSSSSSSSVPSSSSSSS